MPNIINLRLLDNRNIVAELNGIPLANENSYKIIAGESNATEFNIASKPIQYANAQYTVELVNSQGYAVKIPDMQLVQGSQKEYILETDGFILPRGMAVGGYGYIQIRAYLGEEVVTFMPLKIKIWNTLPISQDDISLYIGAKVENGDLYINKNGYWYNLGSVSETKVIQSDWNETDSNKPAFIKNKPPIDFVSNYILDLDTFTKEGQYIMTGTILENTPSFVKSGAKFRLEVETSTSNAYKQQYVTYANWAAYRTKPTNAPAPFNVWSEWKEKDTFKENGGDSSIIIGEKVNIPVNAWSKLENSQPYFYQATVSVNTPLSENSYVDILRDNPVLMANFGFAVGGTNDSTQEVTFYASVVPVGDVELTLSVLNGNTIVDKEGNVITIEEENATILATDWVELENSQPFDYQATITLTTELGDNTSLGIANDRPVFFAKYGLMVGNIEGQQVTIYAIALPPEEINTITFEIMREEEQ